MAANDINGAPLNVGDEVIVLFGRVAEVGEGQVLLVLPDGHSIPAQGDQLEKITGGSISGAIAAAIPAAETGTILTDSDGNPLTVELVNGRRVLATSGRTEKLLSDQTLLLVQIRDLLAAK